MAVLPTPASPTNSGLFLRRRHRIWTVRSTSSRRPIKGSMRPCRAISLRLEAKFSSGLAFWFSVFSSLCGAAASCSSAFFEMPCEMKFTTSNRLISCCFNRYTACDSCSPKIATSTLAPVTSLLPEDCTCSTARCSTRWNPRVGWVSRGSSELSTGVLSRMKVCKSRFSLSRWAPHARNTSEAAGLSSSANNKCSTVMNSWRRSRASRKARLMENSRSLLNITHTSNRAGVMGFKPLLGYITTDAGAGGRTRSPAPPWFPQYHEYRPRTPLDHGYERAT